MLTIITAVLSLLRGPLFSIIDKLIPDGSLKARLKAEIEQRLLQSDDHLAELQAEMLGIELKSESWMTRSWRPLLMYLIMALLAFYGFLLPLAEAVFGKVEFEPRWHQFPDGLWTLLMLGVGGYIGGRTVEKLARVSVGKVPPPVEAPFNEKLPKRDRRSRQNFNRKGRH